MADIAYKAKNMEDIAEVFDTFATQQDAAMRRRRSQECERARRGDERAERDEHRERLDRDMGS